MHSRPQGAGGPAMIPRVAVPEAGSKPHNLELPGPSGQGAGAAFLGDHGVGKHSRGKEHRDASFPIEKKRAVYTPSLVLVQYKQNIKLAALDGRQISN